MHRIMFVIMIFILFTYSKNAYSAETKNKYNLKYVKFSDSIKRMDIFGKTKDKSGNLFEISSSIINQGKVSIDSSTYFKTRSIVVLKINEKIAMIATEISFHDPEHKLVFVRTENPDTNKIVLSQHNIPSSGEIGVKGVLDSIMNDKGSIASGTWELKKNDENLADFVEKRTAEIDGAKEWTSESITTISEDGKIKTFKITFMFPKGNLEIISDQINIVE